MINIDDLTIGQINQIKALFGGACHPYEPLTKVGQCVFIRTVTHHYTGRVTKINDTWLELEDAAWIADDGRFHDFLKSGDANEVEPFVNPVRILIGTILDITEWKNALPTKQK